MATYHSGETNSTASNSRHWPTAAYVCIIVVALIIALLFVMPGLGSRGSGPGSMPVQNVQGENVAAGNPQAGAPGGPAPAHQEEDPLAR